ncbi:MAG TPA: BTAD domain-containing putative transcriptional regulator, partial [Acidimicrobiales bacterium]|nr:BTAD domain-containing putative transcriptional regulator [Acidimicrobiales bacterium]
MEVIGDDGEPVVLTSDKERALLATLLLGANEMVSTARLIDALWGEEPPPTAGNALQAHVSKLRKKLGAASRDPAVIESSRSGYLLRVRPHELDVEEFEELLSAEHADDGRERFPAALALWRGPALDDVESDALRAERARLDEMRSLAFERRVEGDLEDGRHLEVLPELERMVRLEPLREGPRRQLMIALYRSGRQADALAAYQQGRELLAEELGIDPGPQLQELEMAILRQLPELDAPARSARGSAPLGSLESDELPNNLPTHLSSFVGREREVAEVRSLVSSSRLVTLTGAGGSGKTRIALQVAAELLDGSGSGVWLVELAPLTDGDQVAVAAATTLGIRVPESHLPQALVDALSDQRILIVLDNCEHLVDACAKLVDRLCRACPGVHVLATSRDPLSIDGEHIYRVQPLSVPEAEAETVDEIGGSEAVELFVERAAALDNTFALGDSSAALVASICRRLEGIPLALELAAARLSTMSLEHLADRLGQRFKLLTGGSRNALPHHKTLRATIEWSYDLLSEPEREVLRRLSVFSGGFELDSAEALCVTPTLEEIDAADVIGSLVQKSLLQTDRFAGFLRYRLLEMVREYAAERLAEEGAGVAEACRALHAAIYLQLAERAEPELFGPNQGRWLNRLDLEWDNLS